eukprot:TRINITY_DN10367_c0_g1_i3.p1 TRINITY_DN10367_c0_g1~~TRINITY_DN10367_c0_g1_i3.p1  ORF type:complete len:410 (+),score=122.13 TRINITY_DN10367_c0_g1_i3:86-1315(+)
MAGQMQLSEKATEAMAGRIEAAPGQDHAKSILCAICDTPAFETPVKAANCLHLFDRECLVRWLQGKDGDKRTCPVCRMVLPPGDAAYTEAEHFVREIIADTKVHCPQDCEEPHPKRMRYDQLAAHIRACPQTPVLCGNVGCDKVVAQKEVGAHAVECQHAPVRCVQCDKQMKRKVMQDHLSGDCPRRRYQCGYCKQSDLVFANKDAHEQTCPGQVPVGWLVDMRQQNRDLKEENKGLQEENRDLKEENKGLYEGSRELKEENRKLQERNKELQEMLGKDLKNHGKELETQGKELKKLRKQSAELQQNVRVALCCRIKVASKEKPELDGEYTILPERHNDCRVWGGDRGFLYKHKYGRWMVASSRAAMLSDTGLLENVRVDCDYPTFSGGWKFSTGSTWEAAPGTTVTAV